MMITKLELELTWEELSHLRSLYDDGDGCYEEDEIILFNHLVEDLNECLCPATIEYRIV